MADGPATPASSGREREPKAPYEALTHAMEENATLLAETMPGAEASGHLRRMRGEATATSEMMKSVGADKSQPAPSRGLARMETSSFVGVVGSLRAFRRQPWVAAACLGATGRGLAA
jgi:hypothetical protein